MGDKLTNLLIILILIIIVGLVGIYFYKVVDSTYSENKIDSEEYQLQNMATNTQNTNDTTIEEEKNNIQSSEIVIPSVNETISSNTEPITTTVSTYEYNNRYYYKQLDRYSKIIYDAIVENIGNLKSGNYVIKIEEDFGPLLSKENGRTKLNDYYDDAINAINLDIPNLFYIDFSKMYLNIETTSTIFDTTYELYISPGTNLNYFTQGFSTKAQVEATINSIENIKNTVHNTAKGDTYSKIRIIHDWIIEYMSYDASSSNKGSIYGAMIENKAVCEGYARTFKYLIDELGVENILAVGTGTNSSGETEDHMWNYVLLNGKWYAVDCTWDDPIVQGGGTLSPETKHKYFLIGRYRVL